MAKKKRISQAISEAIMEEMIRDENVVMIGEDVESGNEWKFYRIFG